MKQAKLRQLGSGGLRRWSPWWKAACLITWVMVVGQVVALESERWAFPVPLPFGYPVPDWADAPVVEQGEATTSLHIPLVAAGVRAGRQLVVTFYFNEAVGGFLRVQWDGVAGVATLATNLFEGVGGAHRRSLLIPQDYLESPGVLTVVSGGENSLYQVELEWLSEEEVLAGAEKNLPAAVLSGGREATQSELLGSAYRPVFSDEWEGDVIKAPLTDRIERVEGGLVFVAPLSRAPEQARLALWIAGPAMAAEFRLQVNGKDAGAVAFEAPPLTDLGYYRNEAGDWFFAGWRKGTIAIRQSLLVAGDNEFELIKVGVAENRPVAIKDMILQLRYSTPSVAREENVDDDVASEDLFGGYSGEGGSENELPGGIKFLISEPELVLMD